MNSPFKHFVFVASSDSPSPTGRGSQDKWLRHYKIEREDEVFIPWDGEHGVPQRGDYLWMQINKDVIAMAAIERVEEDMMSGRLELWFSGSNIKTVENVKSDLTTGRVAELTGQLWLKQLQAT
jgi:hypothetical protein